MGLAQGPKSVPAYIRKLILLDDNITSLFVKRGGEQDRNATTNLLPQID